MTEIFRGCFELRLEQSPDVSYWRGPPNFDEIFATGVEFLEYIIWLKLWVSKESNIIYCIDIVSTTWSAPHDYSAA